MSSCGWRQIELQVEEIVYLIINHPSKIDEISVEYDIEFSTMFINNHSLLGVTDFLVKNFENKDYSLVCEEGINFRSKKCSSCFKDNGDKKVCVVFVTNDKQQFGKVSLAKFTFAKYNDKLFLEDISFE